MVGFPELLCIYSSMMNEEGWKVIHTVVVHTCASIRYEVPDLSEGVENVVPLFCLHLRAHTKFGLEFLGKFMHPASCRITRTRARVIALLTIGGQAPAVRDKNTPGVIGFF